MQSAVVLSLKMILLAILASSAIVSGAGEPTFEYHCDNINYIGSKLSRCVPYDALDVAFYSIAADGIVSGQEVSDLVSSFCSNQTIKQKVSDCFDEAIRGCPESVSVRRFIETSSLAFFNFFCSKENAAEWIHKSLLGSGNIWVTTDCMANAERATYQCLSESFSSQFEKILNMTIEDAGQQIAGLMEDAFFCTEEQVRNMSMENCASSWEDLFLMNWIQIRIRINPAFILSNTCVQTLKKYKATPFDAFATQLFH